MKKIQSYFFPKPETKIFKGFGPAFLAIALGIGSGEFILWPYLSAHYGFGVLWGALLGISLQLLLVVVIERQTAFLGQDVLGNFSRIWKRAFAWIFFSTLIGFGWPGFAAMTSDLLIQGFDLPFSHLYLSSIILVCALLVLLWGKESYRNILLLQKINVSFLFILVLFLFIYYFDFDLIGKMLLGLFGFGSSYFAIPDKISLLSFFGAIAYAGSGGNLLLMNSFYVEKEKKGLTVVGDSNNYKTVEDSSLSLQHARLFSRISWKQNMIFFWGTGLILILLLSYVSYAVLHGVSGVPEDFSFLVHEAYIFSRDIHPIIGKLFILSGAFALFGVQLGIFDFIGRILGNRKGIVDGSAKQQKEYKKAILVMGIFGLLVFLFGFTKPQELIILGSLVNAFAMGIISVFLFFVEKRFIHKKLSSLFLRSSLLFSAIFYIGFFFYVVFDKFIK